MDREKSETRVLSGVESRQKVLHQLQPKRQKGKRGATVKATRQQAAMFLDRNALGKYLQIVARLLGHSVTV
jgi:hypothetical protein